jgi:hypothetical protein
MSDENEDYLIEKKLIDIRYLPRNMGDELEQSKIAYAETKHEEESNAQLQRTSETSYEKQVFKAECSNFSLLKKMLIKYKGNSEIINQRGRDGYTMLHSAIEYIQDINLSMRVVRLLLIAGADPELTTTTYVPLTIYDINKEANSDFSYRYRMRKTIEKTLEELGLSRPQSGEKRKMTAGKSRKQNNKTKRRTKKRKTYKKN